MGTLAELHKEHKARRERIRKAAIAVKPAVAIEEAIVPIEEIPEVPVGPNLGIMSTFDIFVYGICQYYNVRKLDLLSQRRIKKITEQRHMLTYMLYRMTDLTTGQIAPKMDRDTTTSGYSIHKILGEIEAKMKEIEDLEKIILAMLKQRKDLNAPQPF